MNFRFQIFLILLVLPIKYAITCEPILVNLEGYTEQCNTYKNKMGKHPGLFFTYNETYPLVENDKSDCLVTLNFKEAIFPLPLKASYDYQIKSFNEHHHSIGINLPHNSYLIATIQAKNNKIKTIEHVGINKNELNPDLIDIHTLKHDLFGTELNGKTGLIIDSYNFTPDDIMCNCKSQKDDIKILTLLDFKSLLPIYLGSSNIRVYKTYNWGIEGIFITFQNDQNLYASWRGFNELYEYSYEFKFTHENKMNIGDDILNYFVKKELSECRESKVVLDIEKKLPWNISN